MKSKKILLALSALVLLASCSSTTIPGGSSVGGDDTSSISSSTEISSSDETSDSSSISEVTSSDSSSSSEVSSDSSSNSEVSSDSYNSGDTTIDSSSSIEDSSPYQPVLTYSLSVTSSKNVFEVGDSLDFSDINVTLTTFSDGTQSTTKTLSTSEYTVKVGDTTLSGTSYEFKTKGEVTFTFTSNEGSATATLKVKVEQHFKITNASSDKATLKGLPSVAEEGDIISFTLYLLPGVYFESLSILDASSTDVTFTESDDVYKFTMPSSDVSIVVNAPLNDYSITKDEDLISDVELIDGESSKVVTSAVAGSSLRFKTKESEDYSATKVYINGVEQTIGEDGYYSFTMPHHPVTISVDKTFREYEITHSELSLSTVKIYTNTETKEEITTAHKGEKVYIELSYSAKLVKYTITTTLGDNKKYIKPVQDKDNPNLFSFEMQSTSVKLNIKEEDYSEYYGYYVVDKDYCLKETNGNWEGTDKALMNSAYYSFKSNGSFTASNNSSSYDLTWTTNVSESDTEGVINATYENYYGTKQTKTVYFTEHLVLSLGYQPYVDQSNTYILVGTWDNNTSFSVLSLNSNYNKIVYTKDDNNNLVEKMFSYNNKVYINNEFSVYTDEECTQAALSTDLTTSSTFFVKLNNDEGTIISYINGSIATKYKLSSEESEQYTVSFTDVDGNSITNAYNGSTVNVNVNLSESLTEGAYVDKLTYKTSSSTYSNTISKNSDGVYSFEMPNNDVTVTATIKEPNKYLGYKAVGYYEGITIGTDIDDKTYSGTDKPNMTAYLNKEGKFKQGFAQANDITSITNGDEGTFVVENNTWTYGKNIIARSNGTSIYALYRTGNEEKSELDYTTTTVKMQINYVNNDTATITAVAVYFNDELKATVFRYNDELLVDVEFSLLNDQTSLHGGQYTVSKNGVTLYSVANGEVTSINASQEE